MEGEIGVADQLGREAEQILTLFARKMQLHEIKLQLLSERERETEKEERELIRQIEELKLKDMTYKRESTSAREQLALKSHQFQEITRAAADRLSVEALRRETKLLGERARELRAKEARLQQELEGRAPVGDDAVAALVAKAKFLQRRFQLVIGEHQKVSADVEAAILEAHREQTVSEQEETEEAEYCRQLEEAIEDMTLLQVDAELTRSAAVAGPGAIVGRSEEPTEPAEPAPGGSADAAHSADAALEAAQRAQTAAALSRLSLQRAEVDCKFGKLAAVLGDLASRYRELDAEPLLQAEAVPEAVPEAVVLEAVPEAAPDALSAPAEGAANTTHSQATVEALMSDAPRLPRPGLPGRRQRSPYRQLSGNSENYVEDEIVLE